MYLKGVFDRSYCIKHRILAKFCIRFCTFFVMIFNGSHMVSFTFDILDPRLLVAHASFSICLDILVLSGVLLSYDDLIQLYINCL